MTHNRFNTFLAGLAMMMLVTTAAFAQNKSNNTTITKPAPAVWQRQAIGPVKHPTVTQHSVKMNPERPLPKTFTPRNASEKLFTGGVDAHPVQFHRGNGKSLPPIYATGAGPRTYTNPLLVLQPKKGRK